MIVGRYLGVPAEADLSDPQRRPSEHGIRRWRFALDYARAVKHKELRELIEERSRAYYRQGRRRSRRAWEPDGADFFSPSLMEADLMRRVLPADEFRAWLGRFLPGLAKGEPKTLLTPATVTDRSDPQIVHLDGLNLSRAWCMNSIAHSLAKDDPARIFAWLMYFTVSVNFISP